MFVNKYTLGIGCVNLEWVQAIYREAILGIREKMNKDVNLYVTLESNIVK